MSAPAAVAVRERPILFSGPMVRALLDGTKTQTRRVVSDATSQGNWKPSQCDLATAWVDPGPSPAGNRGPYLKAHVTACEYDDGIVDRIYPRWFPVDRLWVRETWQDWCPIWSGYWCSCGSQEMRATTHRPAYRATPDERGEPKKWAPSIHMPRWASRITLELTGVRVERVQDISEDDARAEGAGPCCERHVHFDGQAYRCEYQHLWDSLNAKRGYGWFANPWVWVLEFRTVRPAEERADA